MLAKKMKIENLKRQREYIEQMISFPKKDGNPAITYIGYVFPENQEYFRKEGIWVGQVENKELEAKTKGLPIFLFMPSEDVKLTEEELEEAEAVPSISEEMDELADKMAGEFMEMLFGRKPNFEGMDEMADKMPVDFMEMLFGGKHNPEE